MRDWISAQPGSTPALEEGVIDLDTFDYIIEQIELQISRIKTGILNKSKDRTLPNSDFSQILDNLETIRQEAESAIAVLTNK